MIQSNGNVAPLPRGNRNPYLALCLIFEKWPHHVWHPNNISITKQDSFKKRQLYLLINKLQEINCINHVSYQKFSYYRKKKAYNWSSANTLLRFMITSNKNNKSTLNINVLRVFLVASYDTSQLFLLKR